MHVAARIGQCDYSGQYCQDGALVAAHQAKCARFFGIDHVNVSTDAYREAHAWGVQLDFNYHTPIAKSELNIEEFDQIEPPEVASEVRMQDRIKAIKILKETIGNEYAIVGWIEAPFAELCSIFGINPIIGLFKSEEGRKRMQQLFTRILPIQHEFAMQQIEAGADIIGAGDSMVSQIGPRNYARTAFSPTQTLFTKICQKAPVLYHLCGDNSGITGDGYDMLQLVADTGASVLDLDFQVDLSLAKQKIGHKVCIRGNVNTQVLGSTIYSLERVREEIKNTILAGKPGGRYMYAAGCEVPWDPWDLSIRNLAIAHSLTEEIGWY
jgi:uroporphyrinogen-III decarboxylase